MLQPSTTRIRWEDFEVDLQLRRLFRRGHRVKLQPIPFQVLALLLERPGQLVTRDELHKKIWNGYSYGDFDHNLNIAIAKLRGALSDPARQPRFIETLPQVGYRFIAPVEAKAEPAPVATGAELPAGNTSFWRQHAPAWAAAILFLSVGGWWAGSRILQTGKSAESTEAALIEPLGVPPGRVAYIAADPASGPFRFTGSGADYVRVPNNPLLEPQQVTVDAWVRSPSSPGRYRYIVAKGAEECGGSSYGLYTGVLGGLVFYVSGPPKILAALSPPAPQSIWDGKWHHVTGTYDGSVVRLFVDGAEIGFGVPSPNEMRIHYRLSTDNDLLVGSFVGTCSAPFKGEIGEVQVFNRALSQTEILSLFKARAGRYQEVLPQPASPQRAKSGCTPPPAGLIGSWTAETGLREDIQNAQYFEVGGVNRGIGKVGIGIQFLGDGHLEFRDAPQFDLSGPLTLEGWIYYTGFSVSPRDGGVLIARWGDSVFAGPSYGLFVRANGVPYFALSSDGVQLARIEAPLPLVVELTHLAGVWDGATMFLYANGALVASAPFAGPLLRGTGPLHIGGRTNPATGRQETFIGIMDEIGVYNRALSQEEVAAIHRAGSAGKCRAAEKSEARSAGSR